MSNADILLYDNGYRIVKQNDYKIIYHRFYSLNNGKQIEYYEDKKNYIEFGKVIMCPPQWCYKTNLIITKGWNDLIMNKLNELNNAIR